MGNEKSLYVASVGSLVAFLLPTVFQTFMKEQPECCLHVTTLHSVDAYSYVNNQTVDIAFITDPMYSSRVKTTMLFREELCLVVGKDLNLPEKLKISELDPRQEIRTQWDRNFDAWHTYYFGSSAIPRVYLDEMGFLQYFAQNGDNWAFMPRSIAKSMVKDLSLIHIWHVLSSCSCYHGRIPFAESGPEICECQYLGHSPVPGIGIRRSVFRPASPREDDRPDDHWLRLSVCRGPSCGGEV